jgi:predicted HTH transcriptional regulator
MESQNVEYKQSWKDDYLNVKKDDNDNENVVSDAVSLSQVYLTERQKIICQMIEDDPSVSSKQMSQVLSVDPRTVQRDLAVMQKKGVLIREGNTSAGRWVFNKQPPKNHDFFQRLTNEFICVI